MIIDTVKENRVGVGFNWPPFRIGSKEIMI